MLPFFTWTPDWQQAIFITVNRDHTELTLNMWTPQTGVLRTLIQETAPDWINENPYAAPVFIGDGGQFLWLSERDGFMHLYLYSQAGELIRQLTQGEWLIDTPAWNLLTPGKPVHVDPTGAFAYFITTRNSPLERQVDRLDIATGELTQISGTPGFHAFALSGDGNYLVDQFSDVATPPVTWLLHADGSQCCGAGRGCRPGPAAAPGQPRVHHRLAAEDGTHALCPACQAGELRPEPGSTRW